MDIFSHGLWGYASLRFKGKKLARWGILAGMGPDLVYGGSKIIEQVTKEGWSGLKLERPPPGAFRKDGPPLPQSFLDAYSDYYVYTHSLVILAGVGLVYAVWKKKFPWLAIPWGLHILMDIPSHERYLTPFLFPLSDFTIQGVSWGHPAIFWTNWGLLIATLTYIHFKVRED